VAKWCIFFPGDANAIGRYTTNFLVIELLNEDTAFKLPSLEQMNDTELHGIHSVKAITKPNSIYFYSDINN